MGGGDRASPRVSISRLVSAAMVKFCVYVVHVVCVFNILSIYIEISARHESYLSETGMANQQFVLKYKGLLDNRTEFRIV